MTRHKARSAMSDVPDDVRECLDFIQIVDTRRVEAEREYKQFMTKCPEGSAPGLLETIASAQARIKELEEILPRLS